MIKNMHRYSYILYSLEETTFKETVITSQFTGKSNHFPLCWSRNAMQYKYRCPGKLIKL